MEKYGMRFKDMNRQQKTKHIWEYYRYHIIGTIIAFVAVISLAITMLCPPEPNEVDILLAGQMDIIDSSEVIETFKEQYKTGIEFSPVNWEREDGMSTAMTQKIPLMIMTNELDILAISPTVFDDYAEGYGKKMFIALDEIPELESLLNQYQDQLYICDKITDEKGNVIETEAHVYGIITNKFSNLPCIEACEALSIGISAEAKDVEKAISMLKYILE